MGCFGSLESILGYNGSALAYIAFESILENIRSTFGYFGSTLGYVESTLEYIGTTLGHSGGTWEYVWSIQA